MPNEESCRKLPIAVEKVLPDFPTVGVQVRVVAKNLFLTPPGLIGPFRYDGSSAYPGLRSPKNPPMPKNAPSIPLDLASNFSGPV